MRAAVCIVLLAAAGCGGDGSTLEPSQLRDAVLQPGDLPQGFERMAHGPRGGPTAWESRYAGPLVVTSQVELHASPSRAEAEVEAELEHVRTEAWQPIDDPGLGGGSFAATTGGASTRRYRVVWRDGNVVAEVYVAGETPLGDVLELARKQERRIEAAG